MSPQKAGKYLAIRCDLDLVNVRSFKISCLAWVLNRIKKILSIRQEDISNQIYVDCQQSNSCNGNDQKFKWSVAKSMFTNWCVVMSIHGYAPKPKMAKLSFRLSLVNKAKFSQVTNDSLANKRSKSINGIGSKLFFIIFNPQTQQWFLVVLSRSTLKLKSRKSLL